MKNIRNKASSGVNASQVRSVSFEADPNYNQEAKNGLPKMCR